MSSALSTGSGLAINGGTPVRTQMLPYGRQSVDESDVEAVVETLRSPWLTTGPKVEEFEERFASMVGASYAVSFSSGTAALHAATFAAGLGPEDEAIVPTMTFCATANCTVYVGARPVLTDVLDSDLTIDPDAVADAVTPRTRAILPVDYAGHPADLTAMLDIADRHGLVVIEDASHSLGAAYRGRPIGSVGHMTTFSFHPVKHITTAEGGMVATDDESLGRRLRTFRNHGIDRDSGERMEAGDWVYRVVSLGHNFRLSDLACALGLSQLGRLEANLDRRRTIAATYQERFFGLDVVRLPHEKDHVSSAWHLYPIRLDLSGLRTDRRGVFKALRAENIGVNVHYIPIHLHPFYQDTFGYRTGQFPRAEAAYDSLISLPMFHAMTDQDVDDVVHAVRKVVHHYRA
jgi:perosamine synthetase